MSGTAVVGVDGMWATGNDGREEMRGGTRITHGFRGEPLLIILRAHVRSSVFIDLVAGFTRLWVRVGLVSLPAIKGEDVRRTGEW
jgi:hypothetical protein